MVNAPRHTLLLCGWLLHLVATPFYIFESGNPQPADALMALLMACLLSGLFVRLPRATDLYASVGIFLVIAVNVNLFWYTIHLDDFFWKSSLFYIFNVCSMIAVIVLASAVGVERLCRWTALGIMLSVLVEVAAVFVMPSGGMRALGTFNNPNQLGYWCLISAACWLVVRGEDRLDLLDLAVLAGFGYLATLSLSNAAMGSFVLLLLCGMAAHGLRGRWTTVAAGALLLCLPILIVQPSLVGNRIDSLLSGEIVSNVIDRFESIGQQQDDSLAGRGYDRLWLYPEYLLFGAGEGNYDRFSDSALQGLELHSSWGTLLFSYGIVGFLAFTGVLWAVFRQAPLRYWTYFVPIAAYGLTHQGLRFSLFWVFLGLVYAVSRQAVAVSAEAVPAARAAAAGDGEITGEEALALSYAKPSGRGPGARRAQGESL